MLSARHRNSHGQQQKPFRNLEVAILYQSDVELHLDFEENKCKSWRSSEHGAFIFCLLLAERMPRAVCLLRKR